MKEEGGGGEGCRQILTKQECPHLMGLKLTLVLSLLLAQFLLLHTHTDTHKRADNALTFRAQKQSLV